MQVLVLAVSFGRDLIRIVAAEAVKVCAARHAENKQYISQIFGPRILWTLQPG